jgi:uncharacterized protein YdeI (YjbR/CyaY-like superfamily)
MEATFFATPKDLRKWLEKNHEKETELWVGLYKKGSGKPSVTWPEVVDQCLCFGWIDGIRQSIDGESYRNRITPRKARSNWSAINIKRIEELIKEGLVKQAGLDAYAKRVEARSRVYAFEQGELQLDKSQEAKFRKNKKAWDFFHSMPAHYKKTALWWVISAKQEVTRERRLETLIKDSENGERIAQLRPAPRKK